MNKKKPTIKGKGDTQHAKPATPKQPPVKNRAAKDTNPPINQGPLSTSRWPRNRPEKNRLAQSDFEGQLPSAGIIMICLDEKLHLQRYSAGAEALFSILPTDLGRPLNRLKHKLQYKHLAGEAAQVLKMQVPVERQLQDLEGHQFLVRIHPYHGKDEPSGGVALTFVDITALFDQYTNERKQAEEQLRELSQRLTYHVDNSPLAVIEWGPDMRLIRWSAEAERMFGWKAEEVLGKRMTDFRWIYDEDVSQVDDVSSELKTGRDPQRFSANRNYRKDGSVIHCEWYNSSLVDESGKLRSILSLVLDVTGRSKAEEELRESRRKYQDLIETTGDFIWEMDNQGRYTYCSPQMRALWGMDPESMVGKNPFDFIPPEEKEEARASFTEQAASGMPFKGLTSTALNSQGQQIFIETSGVPFFDPHGKLLGYRGITRDVTERQRVEQQLEQSNLKLNEILESIQDDFYVLDRNWRFVYASRLFTSKIGKEAEDFAGNNIWEMFPKHIGTILEENFRAAMEKREVRRFEVGGKYTAAWYRMTAFPSAEGITVLGTDISEQKKVEEALKENQKELALLNETLEHRVSEQTAELRRLASDLTKAEHRERHRISHILHDDLQQRLYAIQMQMDFLRQDYQIEDPKLKRELAEVGQQLTDILGVTRHLSIDLSPPVLPGEGLTQAIRWLAAQMREQYGLKIELQASGPFSLHDEAMQVLLFNCVRELLFNVVKHSGVKQAQVTLQWADGGLRIDVCDQGQGFAAGGAEAPLPDSEEAEEDPHTSFGLPTIRHRLSLFGGQMKIKSAPGAGTQITLSIPLEEKTDDGGRGTEDRGEAR